MQILDNFLDKAKHFLWFKGVRSKSSTFSFERCIKRIVEKLFEIIYSQIVLPNLD